MKTSNTWLELAALPLVAGFSLGTTFVMGGDASIRMIKTFAPSALMASAVPQEGSHPGRHWLRALSHGDFVKTDAAEARRLGHELKMEESSRKIVVAVIDTGADISHPDLRDNIWTNPGESGRDECGRDKSSNGIDDDGNGYVDDVHGWNFVFENENVEDNHGHGTHIAGLIGASGARRLTGVAPSVSLMILKYFDPKKPNQNPLAATIHAIRYAVKNGADIINYSGGGVNPSAEEFAALQEASDKGILVVAAAGNEHANSDQFKYFPADYKLPNIMSVTAINPRSKVLPTSNYGVATVDIAAPGEDILSTLPGGEYGLMTGTSQATAFATGVAALVMAHSPSMIGHPREVIDHLVNTGETSSALIGKTRTRAILNAYRAVAIRESGVAVAGVEVATAENASFILPK